MTKVDLNHYTFHRKFDGKLKMIDLGIKDSHRNEKKMCKVFKVLGYGKIDQYIDKEDIDPEDMLSETDDSEDSSDISDIDSEEDSDPDNDCKKHTSEKNKKTGDLPKITKR